MPTGHTHRQPYPYTPRHRTPGHATQTPIYDAMVDALTSTRDNDLHAMPDVHNGPVHDPHTLLPHGEVLVALPYKPAFPGVLDPV